MRDVLRVGDRCKNRSGRPIHFISSKADLTRAGGCRECHILGCREYLAEHAPRINKRRRASHKKNPMPKRLSDAKYSVAHKTQRKMYYDVWYPNNLERHMIYSARRRAKKYNVPFALSHTDIHVPKVCPVLGIRLKSGVGRSTDNSPTLDRIRPHRGYVKGNVAVISSLANRIKTDATLEQVEKVLRWMKKLRRQ